MKSKTEQIEDICRDLEQRGNFAASTVGEALRQLTDFDSESDEEILIAAVSLEELKDWAETTAQKLRAIIGN
jgi:hypothetical protein